MYQYVAQSNPAMAKALCHKYGYKITGVSDINGLAECLKQLVANEGETALKDVIKNHPDRELIIEVEELDRVNFAAADGVRNQHAGCASCKQGSGAYSQYANFNGGEYENKSKSSSMSQGTFILASAFLLGMAIIAAKM